MIGTDSALLIWTAASVGVIHTLAGPDHYLPFVMLGQAGDWSRKKLVLITALCGVGHVASSIVLSLVGVLAGVAVGQLEIVEGWRGDLAAWLLTGFGLAYALWGIRRGLRGKSHRHTHVHGDGELHIHEHNHRETEHAHPHAAGRGNRSAAATTWTLFVVFILGPCEPMIPIVMVPASRGAWLEACVVSGVFGTVTVLAMIGAVLFLRAGFRMVPMRWMERYVHALAGFVIAGSGAAILFLGL